MRNIITYSVFVMLFSMFSGSVFAGQYQECEPFKGMKRLYGLCNAYQNAFNAGDEESMADILANWDKWATDDTPVLPNSPVGTKQPAAFYLECPCWAGMTDEQICSMGFPDFYPSASGGGLLFLEDFMSDPMAANIFYASGEQCEYTQSVMGVYPDPVKITLSGIGASMGSQCMAEVEVIAALDFCDF
jgi:hypothetical protein